MAETVFNTAAAESFIKRFVNTVVFGKAGVILESSIENFLIFCKVPINSSHIVLLELVNNDTDKKIGSIAISLTTGSSYANSSVSVIGVSSSLMDSTVILTSNFEDIQDLNHLILGLKISQVGNIKLTYQSISSNRSIISPLAISKALSENYKEFSVNKGYILSRPLFKETDTLNAFRKWSSTYKYEGNDPVFFGAHLYYANPNNVPSKGEDPIRNPSKWIELATAEIPDTDISKGAKTPQLFNDTSLVITNDNAIGLRKNRRDVGFQYPSANSKVYHFDEDLLDQFQENSLESFIEKDPEGDAQFVLKGMTGLPISSDPAINFKPLKEVPAFYYGSFSLKKSFNYETDNNTFAYHFKYSDTESMVNKELVRITFSNGEYFRLVFNYSEIDYFQDEKISYWNLEDTPVYAQKKFLGSLVAIVSDGLTSTFTTVFEDYPLINDSWVHICFKITTTSIIIFFRGQQVEIPRKTSQLGDVEFLINKDKGAIAIDELIWDTTASIPYSRYIELTSESLPWAEHEKTDNWLIIHAKDLTKVDTNLFETQVFSSKMNSVLDDFTESEKFVNKVKEIIAST